MANSLGITKGEIEIRQGGYYPKGWSTREARVGSAQTWILDLASGARAIPVKIVSDDAKDGGKG